jgi:hypothetical protein
MGIIAMLHIYYRQANVGVAGGRHGLVQMCMQVVTCWCNRQASGIDMNMDKCWAIRVEIGPSWSITPEQRSAHTL